MRGRKVGKEKADKVRKQKVMNNKRKERLGKVEMERCEREGKEKGRERHIRGEKGVERKEEMEKGSREQEKRRKTGMKV